MYLSLVRLESSCRCRQRLLIHKQNGAEIGSKQDSSLQASEAGCFYKLLMARITKTGFSRDREYTKMIGMRGNNMQLLIIYQFNTGLFVFTSSPPVL